MIHLSRLLLNPRSRQVHAELREPYQMHRTLCKAFGDGEGELAEARLLFRVDELPHGKALGLLAQSLAEPRWDALTVPADYLLEAPEVKAWAPHLAAGQRLAFRLRANPTVKRDGKRRWLASEDAQEAWLRRKGDAHGFAPLRVVIHPAQSFRSVTAAGCDAHLVGVTFDGVLRVTDAAALRLALVRGIGSGKAFGFGLLSLAPA